MFKYLVTSPKGCKCWAPNTATIQVHTAFTSVVLVLSSPTRALGRAHAAPVSTDCSTYKLNERSYSRAPSSLHQHQPATQGKQVHCGVPHN